MFAKLFRSAKGRARRKKTCGGLALEILEDRTLLAAGVLGGQHMGHADRHAPPHHDRPAAASHDGGNDSSRHGHHRGDRHGDRNHHRHDRPPRHPLPVASGEGDSNPLPTAPVTPPVAPANPPAFAPLPPASSGLPPVPPPRPVAPAPTATNPLLPPPAFTTPPAVVSPSPGATSDLPLDSAALDSLATSSSSSNSTATRPEPATDQFFAMAADEPWLLETADVSEPLTAAAFAAEAERVVSVLDAELARAGSSVEELAADRPEAQDAVAVREGFVDIGAVTDALLLEVDPDDAGDSDDCSSGDEAPISDTAGRTDGDCHRDWWMLDAHQRRALSPLDDDDSHRQIAAAVETRAGMIELAHGTAQEEGAVGESRELAPDNRSLQMDGTFVRYQAFELAPWPTPAQIEPAEDLPEEEGEAEDPLARHDSTDLRHRLTRAARVTVGPALLGLFLGRRSRRRGSTRR